LQLLLQQVHLLQRLLLLLLLLAWQRLAQMLLQFEVCHTLPCPLMLPLLLLLLLLLQARQHFLLLLLLPVAHQHSLSLLVLLLLLLQSWPAHRDQSAAPGASLGYPPPPLPPTGLRCTAGCTGPPY
jgi:hypothetical protein